MLRHRTTKTLPALLTVIVACHTSFPAHDLGAGFRPAHRVSPAVPSTDAGKNIGTFRIPEVRSLHLPFATAPLLHSIRVAT